VRALPLILSLGAALLLAAPLVRFLRENGHLRENYRGTAIPCPLGLLIPAAALVALIPLALLNGLFDADTLAIAGLYFVLPVAALGLADDAFAGPSRGWRGHGAAALSGSFSTGALKAAGTLGLALAWSALTQPDVAQFLLAAAVLVLATNLFNLLDLRPGRSLKAFVLLGAALTIASLDTAPLLDLGIWIGPILVAGALDLRERGMLGDTGSNVVGAVAGLWLVLTLDELGLAVAVAVLVALTLYGELRSINTLVERAPGLRHLDSLGRTHRA
jgi:UDP-N-acetylmuramyl pentapeptide phosphotransferase/UDP-N-acetylglucosamine-1-phosphate transferase